MKTRKDEMYISEFFICDCHEKGHSLFMDFDDAGYACVTVPFKTHRNFWQRIVIGVKYIFGLKENRYPYQDVMLNREEVENLEKFIKKGKEFWKKKGVSESRPAPPPSIYK